ncbi:MAG: lipoyl(octanoyl) transferase LipB [Gammaproteobacteria bacterium]|nr:MAG: lipoyl(octanoyl) transferase LipB [Gammaproteobacteria bacterium]
MAKLLLRTAAGLQPYGPVWTAMQRFTETRTEGTPDEVWLLEHTPVFTLGRNAREEYLHDAGDIEVVRTDRGGQVTYHGPGQILLYTLLDLKRHGLGVRGLVDLLEGVAIELLGEYGIEAHARPEAPGVYVGEAKIAALGLRVRRGCSYHGLAFNVDMDLSPFDRIDPCGYRGLPVTDLKRLGITDITPMAAGRRLAGHLARRLGVMLEEGRVLQP